MDKNTLEYERLYQDIIQVGEYPVLKKVVSEAEEPK